MGRSQLAAPPEVPAEPAAVDPMAGLPALGAMVVVKVPAGGGSALVNNESGAPFEMDVPTPQVVTLTTLARLRAGDLVLVA